MRYPFHSMEESLASAAQHPALRSIEVHSLSKTSIFRTSFTREEHQPRFLPGHRSSLASFVELPGDFNAFPHGASTNIRQGSASALSLSLATNGTGATGCPGDSSMSFPLVEKEKEESAHSPRPKDPNAPSARPVPMAGKRAIGRHSDASTSSDDHVEGEGKDRGTPPCHSLFAAAEALNGKLVGGYVRLPSPLHEKEEALVMLRHSGSSSSVESYIQPVEVKALPYCRLEWEEEAEEEAREEVITATLAAKERGSAVASRPQLMHAPSSPSSALLRYSTTHDSHNETDLNSPPPYTSVTNFPTEDDFQMEREAADGSSSVASQKEDDANKVEDDNKESDDGEVVEKEEAAPRVRRHPKALAVHIFGRGWQSISEGSSSLKGMLRYALYRDLVKEEASDLSERRIDLEHSPRVAAGTPFNAAEWEARRELLLVQHQPPEEGFVYSFWLVLEGCGTDDVTADCRVEAGERAVTAVDKEEHSSTFVASPSSSRTMSSRQEARSGVSHTSNSSSSSSSYSAPSYTSSDKRSADQLVEEMGGNMLPSSAWRLICCSVEPLHAWTLEDEDEHEEAENEDRAAVRVPLQHPALEMWSTGLVPLGEGFEEQSWLAFQKLVHGPGKVPGIKKESPAELSTETAVAKRGGAGREQGVSSLSLPPASPTPGRFPSPAPESLTVVWDSQPVQQNESWSSPLSPYRVEEPTFIEGGGAAGVSEVESASKAWWSLCTAALDVIAVIIDGRQEEVACAPKGHPPYRLALSGEEELLGASEYFGFDARDGAEGSRGGSSSSTACGSVARIDFRVHTTLEGSKPSSSSSRSSARASSGVWIALQSAERPEEPIACTFFRPYGLLSRETGEDGFEGEEEGGRLASPAFYHCQQGWLPLYPWDDSFDPSGKRMQYYQPEPLGYLLVSAACCFFVNPPLSVRYRWEEEWWSEGKPSAARTMPAVRGGLGLLAHFAATHLIHSNECGGWVDLHLRSVMGLPCDQKGVDRVFNAVYVSLEVLQDHTLLDVSQEAKSSSAFFTMPLAERVALSQKESSTGETQRDSCGFSHTVLFDHTFRFHVTKVQSLLLRVHRKSAGGATSANEATTCMGYVLLTRPMLLQLFAEARKGGHAVLPLHLSGMDDSHSNGRSVRWSPKDRKRPAAACAAIVLDWNQSPLDPNSEAGREAGCTSTFSPSSLLPSALAVYPTGAQRGSLTALTRPRIRSALLENGFHRYWLCLSGCEVVSLWIAEWVARLGQQQHPQDASSLASGRLVLRLHGDEESALMHLWWPLDENGGTGCWSCRSLNSFCLPPLPRRGSYTCEVGWATAVPPTSVYTAAFSAVSEEVSRVALSRVLFVSPGTPLWWARLGVATWEGSGTVLLGDRDAQKTITSEFISGEWGLTLRLDPLWRQRLDGCDGHGRSTAIEPGFIQCRVQFWREQPRSTKRLQIPAAFAPLDLPRGSVGLLELGMLECSWFSLSASPLPSLQPCHSVGWTVRRLSGESQSEIAWLESGVRSSARGLYFPSYPRRAAELSGEALGPLHRFEWWPARQGAELPWVGVDAASSSGRNVWSEALEVEVLLPGEPDASTPRVAGRATVFLALDCPQCTAEGSFWVPLLFDGKATSKEPSRLNRKKEAGGSVVGWLRLWYRHNWSSLIPRLVESSGGRERASLPCKRLSSVSTRAKESALESRGVLVVWARQVRCWPSVTDTKKQRKKKTESDPVLEMMVSWGGHCQQMMIHSPQESAKAFCTGEAPWVCFAVPEGGQEVLSTMRVQVQSQQKQKNKMNVDTDAAPMPPLLHSFAELTLPLQVRGCLSRLDDTKDLDPPCEASNSIAWECIDEPLWRSDEVEEGGVIAVGEVHLQMLLLLRHPFHDPEEATTPCSTAASPVSSTPTEWLKLFQESLAKEDGAAVQASVVNRLRERLLGPYPVLPMRVRLVNYPTVFLPPLTDKEVLERAVSEDDTSIRQLLYLVWKNAYQRGSAADVDAAPGYLLLEHITWTGREKPTKEGKKKGKEKSSSFFLCVECASADSEAVAAASFAPPAVVHEHSRDTRLNPRLLCHRRKQTSGPIPIDASQASARYPLRCEEDEGESGSTLACRKEVYVLKWILYAGRPEASHAPVAAGQTAMATWWVSHAAGLPNEKDEEKNKRLATLQIYQSTPERLTVPLLSLASDDTGLVSLSESTERVYGWVSFEKRLWRAERSPSRDLEGCIPRQGSGGVGLILPPPHLGSVDSRSTSSLPCMRASNVSFPRQAAFVSPPPLAALNWQLVEVRVEQLELFSTSMVRVVRVSAGDDSFFELVPLVPCGAGAWEGVVVMGGEGSMRLRVDEEGEAGALCIAAMSLLVRGTCNEVQEVPLRGGGGARIGRAVVYTRGLFRSDATVASSLSSHFFKAVLQCRVQPADEWIYGDSSQLDALWSRFQALTSSLLQLKEEVQRTSKAHHAQHVKLEVAKLVHLRRLQEGGRGRSASREGESVKEAHRSLKAAAAAWTQASLTSLHAQLERLRTLQEERESCGRQMLEEAVALGQVSPAVCLRLSFDSHESSENALEGWASTYPTIPALTTWLQRETAVRLLGAAAHPAVAEPGVKSALPSSLSVPMSDGGKPSWGQPVVLDGEREAMTVRVEKAGLSHEVLASTSLELTLPWSVWPACAKTEALVYEPKHLSRALSLSSDPSASAASLFPAHGTSTDAVQVVLEERWNVEVAVGTHQFTFFRLQLPLSPPSTWTGEPNSWMDASARLVFRFYFLFPCTGERVAVSRIARVIQEKEATIDEGPCWWWCACSTVLPRVGFVGAVLTHVSMGVARGRNESASVADGPSSSWTHFIGTWVCNQEVGDAWTAQATRAAAARFYSPGGQLICTMLYAIYPVCPPAAAALTVRSSAFTRQPLRWWHGARRARFDDSLSLTSFSLRFTIRGLEVYTHAKTEGAATEAEKNSSTGPRRLYIRVDHCSGDEENDEQKTLLPVREAMYQSHVCVEKNHDASCGVWVLRDDMLEEKVVEEAGRTSSLSWQVQVMNDLEPVGCETDKLHIHAGMLSEEPKKEASLEWSGIASTAALLHAMAGGVGPQAHDTIALPDVYELWVPLGQDGHPTEAAAGRVRLLWSMQLLERFECVPCSTVGASFSTSISSVHLPHPPPATAATSAAPSTGLLQGLSRSYRQQLLALLGLPVSCVDWPAVKLNWMEEVRAMEAWITSTPVPSARSTVEKKRRLSRDAHLEDWVIVEVEVRDLEVLRRAAPEKQLHPRRPPSLAAASAVEKASLLLQSYFPVVKKQAPPDIEEDKHVLLMGVGRCEVESSAATYSSCSARGSSRPPRFSGVLRDVEWPIAEWSVKRPPGVRAEGEAPALALWQLLGGGAEAEGSQSAPVALLGTVSLTEVTRDLRRLYRYSASERHRAALAAAVEQQAQRASRVKLGLQEEAQEEAPLASALALPYAFTTRWLPMQPDPFLGISSSSTAFVRLHFVRRDREDPVEEAARSTEQALPREKHTRAKAPPAGFSLTASNDCTTTNTMTLYPPHEDLHRIGISASIDAIGCSEQCLAVLRERVLGAEGGGGEGTSSSVSLQLVVRRLEGSEMGEETRVPLQCRSEGCAGDQRWTPVKETGWVPLGVVDRSGGASSGPLCVDLSLLVRDNATKESEMVPRSTSLQVGSGWREVGGGVLRLPSSSIVMSQTRDVAPSSCVRASGGQMPAYRRIAAEAQLQYRLPAAANEAWKELVWNCELSLFPYEEDGPGSMNQDWGKQEEKQELSRAVSHIGRTKVWENRLHPNAAPSPQSHLSLGAVQDILFYWRRHGPAVPPPTHLRAPLYLSLVPSAGIPSPTTLRPPLVLVNRDASGKDTLRKVVGATAVLGCAPLPRPGISFPSLWYGPRYKSMPLEEVPLVWLCGGISVHHPTLPSTRDGTTTAPVSSAVSRIEPHGCTMLKPWYSAVDFAAQTTSPTAADSITPPHLYTELWEALTEACVGRVGLTVTACGSTSGAGPVLYAIIGGGEYDSKGTWSGMKPSNSALLCLSLEEKHGANLRCIPLSAARAAKSEPLNVMFHTAVLLGDRVWVTGGWCAELGISRRVTWDTAACGAKASTSRGQMPGAGDERTSSPFSSLGGGVQWMTGTSEVPLTPSLGVMPRTVSILSSADRTHYLPWFSPLPCAPRLACHSTVAVGTRWVLSYGGLQADTLSGAVTVTSGLFCFDIESGAWSCYEGPMLEGHDDDTKREVVHQEAAVSDTVVEAAWCWPTPRYGHQLLSLPHRPGTFILYGGATRGVPHGSPELVAADDMLWVLELPSSYFHSSAEYTREVPRWRCLAVPPTVPALQPLFRPAVVVLPGKEKEVVVDSSQASPRLEVVLDKRRGEEREMIMCVLGGMNRWCGYTHAARPLDLLLSEAFAYYVEPWCCEEEEGMLGSQGGSVVMVGIVC